MTAPDRTLNRSIFVIAEGDTERAATNRLKRFLDERAGNDPKVRLKVLALDQGLTERRVRGIAERHLQEEGTLGVVTLSDVYPKYRDATQAKETIRSWMPAGGRCHAHVAKHDFEAWLLADWNALLRQAHVARKQPWGMNPEDVDLDNPPAHRISDLFEHEANPRRRYKKPVDGKKLFDALDLERAATMCPELKGFLNCLLSLAGYPPLP